jgi:hypothetical protein
MDNKGTETTLRRVWKAIRNTFFKEAMLRVRLKSQFGDDLKDCHLSFGEKIIESIDRLIRPDMW